MVPFCLSRYSSAQVQDGGRKETSVGFISLRLLQKPLGPGQISTFTVAPLHHPMLFNIITMVQAILLATVYVAITVPYRAAFNDNTTSTCSGLSPPHQNHYKSHINITASIIIATIMYRVVLFKWSHPEKF